MSKLNIIDYYRAQLDSLGFGDKDAFLYHKDEGQLTDPVTFKYAGETRQMVLPTYQMIKAGLVDEVGNECHAFHPLCESVMTGESGTIRFLKQAIKNQLYVKGISFITYMLKALAEGKSSRSATFKKFVAAMTEGVKDPKIDDKLLRSWTNVATYIKDRMDKKTRLMLSIQPDQKIDGVKYLRAANYKHAFSEEQDDGTATYFGVRLERKQDKVIIHNLLTTVFGWYPEEMGSNDQRAYYGSLIRGWAEFVLKFNAHAKGLKDIVPEYELLNDAWLPELDNLSEYDGKIQTLPYNTGSRDSEVETTKRDFRVGGQQTYNEPAAQTVTEIRRTENGLIDPLSLLSPATAPQSGNVFINGTRQVDLSQYTPLEQKLIKEGRTHAQPSKIAAIPLSQALGGGHVSRQQGSAADFFGSNSGNVFATTASNNNPFAGNVGNPFTSSANSNPFAGGNTNNNPFGGSTGGNDGSLFSGML